MQQGRNALAAFEQLAVGDRAAVRDDQCRRIGIVTCAFYVLGFLQDDWSSVSATIAYSVALKSTVAQFKVLTPYPATPLWKQMAPLVYEQVVTGRLTPLAEAIRREVKIADGLLRGNAASALIGALVVLTTGCPGLAGPARELAERLLSTGALAGTASFTDPGLAVRRNSCCLYYLAPGGGLCGDCSLRRRF